MRETRYAFVSVIVPCHNYGRFLSEALASVQRQTYPYWECIIVDDGSTDITAGVALSFIKSDGRFSYVRQPQSGVSAARNRGVERASGRYIQFLDADDTIERRKFELQVGHLENCPEVDLVYGSVSYFGDSEELLSTSDISKVGARWMPGISGCGKGILRALIKGNIMVVNAALVRRLSMENVGGFDVSLRGHEDWEYWIRFASSGKIFKYVNEEGSTAFVRVHKDSTSRDMMLMLQSNIEVRERIHNFLPNKEYVKENEYLAALYFLRLAKLFVSQNKMLKAAKSAFYAVKKARADINILGGVLNVFLPKFLKRHIKREMMKFVKSGNR